MQNQKLVEQQMSSRLLQAMGFSAAVPLFGTPSEAERAQKLMLTSVWTG